VLVESLQEDYYEYLLERTYEELMLIVSSGVFTLREAYRLEKLRRKIHDYQI
jgi:hypothetical protein